MPDYGKENRSMRLFQLFHRQMITELDGEELKQSAVVFAPHPDDETLGCGGTIIKKIQAGGRVDLVVLTDGSRSHARVVSTEHLRAMREQEVLSAARVLGVPRGRVTFLRYPDGGIADRKVDAVNRVRDLLQCLQPKQVFVPCPLEHISDHRVAHGIVLSALQSCGRSVTVFEYPIWFWLHWPWIRLPLRHPRRSLEILKDSLSAGFGLRLMWRFQSAVVIKDVLDCKRQALAQHKTQMTRMIPGTGWPTLGKVEKGQFLRCCLQECEYFHRRRMEGIQSDVEWPLACFGLM